MTRLVIVMDGGLIQQILGDGDTKILLMDYDTEGIDEVNVDINGDEYCSSRRATGPSSSSPDTDAEAQIVADIFALDDEQEARK